MLDLFGFVLDAIVVVYAGTIGAYGVAYDTVEGVTGCA